jgi:glycosyl transferase, family 25
VRGLPWSGFPHSIRCRAVRCVVINLGAEATRWFTVNRALEQAGLNPLRHEAVCGADLSERACASLYSEALNQRQYHRPLSSGEIGCYASHATVWRQLMQSGASSLAVFEDDVTVVGPLAEVLAAIERLPQQWDLVKLIGRQVERPAARAPLRPGCDLIAYRRVPSLTGGYVITRRGAAKLLEHHPPFGRPVDVDIRHWWECGLVVLGAYPYPIREAESARTTTIPNRYHRLDARMRRAKLRLQLEYSWTNWRARHRRTTRDGDDELAAFRALST